MATEVQNGTTAALTVGGSAVALNTAINTAGSYVLEVDVSNLADGDVVAIYDEKKVTSGASAAVQGYYATFGGAAGGARRVVSLPIPVATNEALVWKIQQPAGSSGKTFQWSVKQL